MIPVGSPDARRLAVLGSPIAHSRSPVLHAAAYRVLGLDWSYEAVEVASDGLDDLLDGLDATWRGLSLTMPLKRAVLTRAVRADRLARLTGSANTLLLTGTGLACNTDVGGIVRALGAAGIVGCRHALILGSGATAASAVAAAADLGALDVTVAARTPARAEHLVALAHELGLRASIIGLDAPATAAGRSAVDGSAADLSGVDLVVSTVPNGVELDAALAAPLAASAALLDVAYEPWPTPLAAVFAAAGSTVVPGLAMLAHQALLQVRVFALGDPDVPLPDEDAVLDAMLDAVGLDARGMPAD